jgi:hypothetical protein
MTDQQINAAIAKACDIVGKSGEIYKTPDGWVVDCPQFASDLNAMHEAEKLIYKHHWMWTAYYYAVGAGPFSLHVTARKKAEAFLKVLGKWEEGE